MNIGGNIKAIQKFNSALLLALTLIACSSDNGLDGGGIDGTGYVDRGDTGRASFYVTDAPIDQAKQVIVAFTAMEVIGADGTIRLFEFTEEKKIDLLKLQGTASEALFNDIELDVGEYKSIRLKVNAQQDGIKDSWIEMNDGRQLELHIPSGDQSGLKINHVFSISKDVELAFTIDFDLRKSLALNDKKQIVKLRPVLRMVANDEVGHVKGTVSVSTVLSLCDDLSSYKGAVYLFKGFDAHDKNNFSIDAHITSSLVQFESTAYDYEIGFIEAGKYSVVYSCDLDPSSNTSLYTTNITIGKGQTSTADIGF